MEAISETELEVKSACTQTVKGMIMNKFRLFQGHIKRRSPKAVMETNNSRINRIMKNLRELYFPDSVIYRSRSKWKDESDEDNGRDPVTHEELEEDQDQDTEKDGVVDVNAPPESD